jgi:glycosyltransferase involved in cell wall biosynthesis
VLVSAVIPAYNEKGRIARVVAETGPFVDEIIVVDDGSTDGTAEVAQESGARVVRLDHGGYLQAIRAGFAAAAGDLVVTLDADGEHDPQDIPRLLEPLLEDRADLVLGRRPRIDRPSERLISWLVRRRLPVSDSGTGFRALRHNLARRLTFPGTCICGTSVLEAHALGARISEVPISLRSTAKPRTMAWGHLHQVIVVLRLLNASR